MIQAVLFSLAISVIDQVLDEPFGVYFTFVLEAKYGFNKTTAKTYILDKIKGNCLMVVLSCILIPLILIVVDSAGEYLVVGLSSLVFALILLMQIIVPTLIIPLFYTYTDLAD
jgi:STE24 endopeptidase